MLSQVYSSAIFGIDAYLMEIEVNYPDGAVSGEPGLSTGVGRGWPRPCCNRGSYVPSRAAFSVPFRHRHEPWRTLRAVAGSPVRVRRRTRRQRPAQQHCFT